MGSDGLVFAGSYKKNFGVTRSAAELGETSEPPGPSLSTHADS